MQDTAEVHDMTNPYKGDPLQVKDFPNNDTHQDLRIYKDHDCCLSKQLDSYSWRLLQYIPL